MSTKSLNAIYDLDIFSNTLGDVLTWNVLSAIHCDELLFKRIDVNICFQEHSDECRIQIDRRSDANYNLLFNELVGVFGTLPQMENLFVFLQRKEMLERLREYSGDEPNKRVLRNYEETLTRHTAAPMRSVSNNPTSYELINSFASLHGRIPLLNASPGCEPDVTGLLNKRFAGKRFVAIDARRCELDGSHSPEYAGRSDAGMHDWYEFCREAKTTHPDIQFFTLGRLQDVSPELLSLPNVTSVRTLGLGLGHELSLILKCDLFIGPQGGFAQMAFFSIVPYFIIEVSRTANDLYRIVPDTNRLAFSSERQYFVGEKATPKLLIELLNEGMEKVSRRIILPKSPFSIDIDVRCWSWERSQWLYPGATTSRLCTDTNYVEKETAFLVLPKIKEAQAAFRSGEALRGWNILSRIETEFPRVCDRFPEFLRLKMKLALDSGDTAMSRYCYVRLNSLATMNNSWSLFLWLKLGWRRGYPLRTRILKLFHKIWNRKHRILGELVKMFIHALPKQSRS